MTYNNKILLALSGGMDSAAAGVLLSSQNQLQTVNFITKQNSNLNNILQITQRLNVPLRIANLTTEFRLNIINRHLEQIKQGRTPSICAYCNPNFKWSYLKEFAKKLNCAKIATGHYVQTTRIDGYNYITKGVDKTKDQSYFLWGLSQEDISMSLFPLGAMTKLQTRELLIERGWSQIEKTRESMSLCYIPQNKTYSQFVHENLNVNKGSVVDENNCVVGTHSGIQLYTIGQKRGFETDGNYRVIEIDALKNRLIVTQNGERLYTTKFLIESWNIVNHEEFFTSDNMSVKVRGLGRNPVGFCKVKKIDINKIEVILEQPAWAVAKGQSAVFYIGNRLVAGGIIA